MTELTNSQREQLEGIESSAKKQIEERLRRLQQDEVVAHKVPSSYRGVGMKYETVAICRVYKGDFHAAQTQFMQAADIYRQASEAALEEPPYATSFRRVPITFVEALYMASLAGEMETVSENAKAIYELNTTKGRNEIQEDPVFERDKCFLSRCLAGAILDRVDEKDINELKDINKGKQDLNQLYGRAISDFASGSVTGEDELVEQGIESMLKYHNQQRHDDNVIDLIMATEATALLIIARNIGFNIEIESDLIPKRLVEVGV